MIKYSIIIPTLNRAHFVSNAIDSVLRQTCQDLEIVICDDGSTDETSQVLDKYGPRIHRIQTNHRGPGGARNAAISQAQGRYISCLDSDDMWTPWTLECIDRVVDSVKADGLVYLPAQPLTQAFDVNAVRQDPLSMRQYADFLSSPLSSPHGSCSIGAIPRQLIMGVGGFDETMRVASDHDLVLKLCAGIPYTVIDAPVTLLYRMHDGNITLSSPAVHIASYTTIIAKEMKQHAYPGGTARRRARRIRIARLVSEYALRFLAVGEYRQSLVLYARSSRLMLSIHCWCFAALFPVLACLHLVLNPVNLFRERGRQ